MLNQMARPRPFFPRRHGKPPVDERRVLSGIIFINRNGLRWCDAPKEYGPPQWGRESPGNALQPLEAAGVSGCAPPVRAQPRTGVFARIMEGLAAEAAERRTGMIDVSRHAPLLRACLRKYLKAHRTASSLRSSEAEKKSIRWIDFPPNGNPATSAGARSGAVRGSGIDPGGQFPEDGRAERPGLHAVTDARGRPPSFFMTVGQVSDHTGAAALLGSLPAAEWLIADRGHDADWFPALEGRSKQRGIDPVHQDREPALARNPMITGQKPAQEGQMCRAPGGDVLVVIAIRDGPADHRQQDLRERMQDPPDVARVLHRREVIQQRSKA